MTRRSSKSRGKAGDYVVGYGKPPVSGQFKKGVRANPNGRPRKKAVASPSPFDLVLAQTLTITRDGKRREATPEEALQQALVEQAFARDRTGIRKVLKMIETRQAAIARATPETHNVEVLIEKPDPPNANEALRILGIGGDDPSRDNRLALEPWAVQAALDRRRRAPLQGSDLSLVQCSTIDPDQVRWPPERGP
jgi:hypothetical protein